MNPAARAWSVPEVVQTSAMDCGPAALKAIAEGLGRPVSYGRLREACQTDVDGTSIDTIETVMAQMGLDAAQVMLPADRLFTDALPALPALVVVDQPDRSTHFVVVWRRLGPWLQVMDPALGRRWVRRARLVEALHRHELSVPAADWRAWALTAEFARPVRAGLVALGLDGAGADALLGRVEAAGGWFPLAALDAALRCAADLRDAGGLRPGPEAARLVTALFDATTASEDDIYALIPRDHWTVAPDPASLALGERRVLLRGAVLIRVDGRRAAAGDAPPPSPELAAALAERPERSLASAWRLLREDGLLAPAALAAALGLALLGTLVEALLLRGIVGIGDALTLPSQRLGAAALVLSAMGLMMVLRLPIASESMRLGRRLEVRLRMALLAKLPRLTDRYHQSRPVSDMADRSHSLHLVRLLPGMGLHLLQSCGELVLLIGAIAVIDPPSLPLAALMAALALALPALTQRMVTESELRSRAQAAALGGVTLDALVGHVPIRVHHAQGAVRRLQEALLVEWSRAVGRLLHASAWAGTLQQAANLGLAVLLVALHVRRTGEGADLLLVWWALKLPAAAGSIGGLALQYPVQRNVVLRLMEPLGAPERTDAATPAPAAGPVGIELRGGRVVASGREILSGLDLAIAPGEHVAVVGASGSGKSTLVGLLMGWHRLAEGALRIDGAPADEAAVARLRRRIAWVDPAVQVWNASLADNLAYAAPDGTSPPGADLIAAADLDAVMRRLPAGLDEPLGEGGALLSGGEGQRVRLGRALHQPGAGLALLDEPFRGLDRTQRARLLQNARARWRHATLLWVTHDLAETMGFARVLVIDDGRLVEDGDPRDLAARPSRFRALLDAEEDLRRTVWEGPQWTHLRMEDGRVRELA